MKRRHTWREALNKRVYSGRYFRVSRNSLTILGFPVQRKRGCKLAGGYYKDFSYQLRPVSCEDTSPVQQVRERIETFLGLPPYAFKGLVEITSREAGYLFLEGAITMEDFRRCEEGNYGLKVPMRLFDFEFIALVRDERDILFGNIFCQKQYRQ